MRATGLKDRIRRGEVTIGSWLSFQYLPLTEMLARREFEWLVIDLEHTTIDLLEVMQMMMVIEAAGLAPLVRVGENDPLVIKRVMDAGAHGILVPNIKSAEEARRAVDAVHYPPRGVRGAGLGRAQGYGVDFDGYREWLRTEAVVVVQIEHVDAVRDLDAIIAVEGVDAFIIGPYDLSASLGKPGEFEDPEVKDLFAELARSVRSAKKPAGIHIVHPDRGVLRDRIAQGYRFIAYGDDMVFYSSVVEDVASHVRDLKDE
jgi:2-keto-3-deoxy-L-rhamnonate aldolase RhmA